MITRKFLIDNKDILNRRVLAEKSDIKKRTLDAKVESGGPEMGLNQAKALEKALKDEGIYKRSKISPKSIVRSPVLKAKGICQRAGYGKKILDALYHKRWDRFDESHKKRFGQVISEIANEI